MENSRFVFFGSIASFILGLAALILRSLVGIPGIILGFVCFREINRSDGRISGRYFALAGMLLGVVGIVLDIIGIIAIIILEASHTSDIVLSQNNLRRIGRAVARYEQHNGHYPTGSLHPPHELTRRLPWVHHEYEKRLSWTVSILPYEFEIKAGANRSVEPRLESEFGQVYRKFNLLAAWNSPDNLDALNSSVRLYVCPGDPNRKPRVRPFHCNYVGMAGIDPEAPFLDVDNPRAGIFGADRIVIEKDLAAGSSHTLLTVETAFQTGPWAAAGRATVRGIDPTAQELFGTKKPFGGCFPNGFHSLMIDGSVRFQNNELSPKLFRDQATLQVDE